MASGVGLFVYKSESRLNNNFESEAAFFKDRPFRLGLDLSGGTHLIYEADLTGVEKGEVRESMDALRDVIERRVNLFGVSEPVVQVQEASLVSGGGEKLIVDLPGVTDIDQAVEMIGQTPLLEFKVEKEEIDLQNIEVSEDGTANIDLTEQFVSTELTGRYLDKAVVEFDPNTRQPIISLQFDKEGAEIFARLTEENVDKPLAIYLDGAPISIPVVNEKIPDGQAVISGSFTPNEAKLLVGRLNSGALPVPIKLLSTQTIGATLGESAVNAGTKAAVIGFIMVAIFLVLWYRLSGLVAVVSLSIFVGIMLSLFKLLPVTITVAGIAGFIISIGVAVDANVLIFERIKEELRDGRSIVDAIEAGFERAWLSIRDSNISSLITALILFWFGTSLIKGFALTLGMGVLVSMFSAIVLSKIFMRVVGLLPENRFTRFLFLSGFSKK